MGVSPTELSEFSSKVSGPSFIGLAWPFLDKELIVLWLVLFADFYEGSRWPFPICEPLLSSPPFLPPFLLLQDILEKEKGGAAPFNTFLSGRVDAICLKARFPR